MTIEETRIVLSILKTTYPNFYKDLSVVEMKRMLEVWQELFQDDDVNLVKVALKQALLTSKFPPSIAELKSFMYEIAIPNKMNVLEAWNLVKKNCVRNGSDAKERFDQLPSDIQSALRSYETLQEWADVSVSEMETHIYPRFRDMYNQAVKENKTNFISSNEQLELKENLKIEQIDSSD